MTQKTSYKANKDGHQKRDPLPTRNSRKTPDQHYRKGLWAEVLAAWILRLKGYRILEQRYKTPVGEIDLVARRGKTLAFVEVKARKTPTDAAEAITHKNKNRVSRAAQYYISAHPDCARFSIQLDAILITRGWPRHIKDAWQIDP